MMRHEDAVRSLEDLPVGETLTIGVMAATKREDGRFAITQSGISVGGANTAETCAMSINPESRPKSTPEQRARWAAERKGR
jgi:hypothetical protein